MFKYLTKRKHSYNISSASTSISITWEKIVPEETEYTIKYRKSSEQRFTSKQTFDDFCEIEELTSDTEYHINVYFDNEDGDPIVLFKTTCRTTKSNTAYLKEQNTTVDKSKNPIIYCFNPVNTREVNENGDKGQDSSKCDGLRVCDMIAEYKPSVHPFEEKTLLLLGGTGSAKSTLIDALVNYIAGVSYSDDFRFAIINKTDEEKKRSENKSQSQTSTNTVYRIPRLKGSPVKCKVNIIDTIGFNDTREGGTCGNRDFKEKLFSGVIENLNAVVIVMPLSVNRLDPYQKEVLKSITNIFGKDIKNIFCLAITHDDNGVLNYSDLVKGFFEFPQSNVFRFNNSFVLERPDNTESIHIKNWSKRYVSFSKLFQKMAELKPTTVKTSHDVMVTRYQLQIQLQALHDRVVEQTQRIVNYKREKEFVEKHKNNKDKASLKFVKRVHEYQYQFTGYSSLICKTCQRTCHDNCWVPFDFLNWTCESIVSDRCTVCDRKCHVDDHERGKYIYKLTMVEKQLTTADFVTEFSGSFKEFIKTVSRVNFLIKELKAKALRPNIMSTPQYIQQIIEKNNEEKEEDYELREVILSTVRDSLTKGTYIDALKLEDLIQ